MTCLGSNELENRGDIFSIIRVKESEDECDLLTFFWMDQDTRYFITLGSSTYEGRTMTRNTLKKIDDVSTNKDPIHVGICARQPKAT